MKVHFADGGKPFGSSEILQRVGVNYLLQTFHTIKRKGFIDKTPIELVNNFNHVIIDSGLFTMMFGSEAGIEISEKFSRDWLDDYIKYINKTPFKNASFVEMDVQKKLGVEAAWDLRREMKTRINKGSVINVYHLEDGNPDKLIDFADYIAVSVPELMFNLSKKERLQVTRYIASNATRKGKRVHLLGCTDKAMMKEFQYCYSCDSTSWRSSARFGLLKSESTGTTHINNIYKSKIGGYEKNADKFTYSSSAMLLLDYQKYAGDQS